MPQCSNSTRDGFRLYQFPKDEKRRKEWLIKCKRDKWSPTPTSKICEVHFEDDQFRGPINRRRYLKNDAVPTIFTHTKSRKRRKSPTKRGLVCSLKEQLPRQDHTYFNPNLSSTVDQENLSFIQDGAPLRTTCVANAPNENPGRVLQALEENSIVVISNTTQGVPVDHFVDHGYAQEVEVMIEDSTVRDNDMPMPYSLEDKENQGHFFRIAANLGPTPLGQSSVDKSCGKNLLVVEPLPKDKSCASSVQKGVRSGNHDNSSCTGQGQDVCSPSCSKEKGQLKRKLRAYEIENLQLKKQLKRVNLEKNKLRMEKARKRTRGRKNNRWTNDEIRRALQLKFACGQTGYELMLSQDYELPSIPTLYRRTEKFAFEPGTLEEVFQLLDTKVKSMVEDEKKCVLTLDEMSLSVGYNYDAKSGRCYGDVTLPDHDGPATHALVFMLGGLTSNWKQAVGYHLTPNSVDGAVFNDIVSDLVKKAASIGLQVVGVTSDMGSSNQKMWK